MSTAPVSFLSDSFALISPGHVMASNVNLTKEFEETMMLNPFMNNHHGMSTSIGNNNGIMLNTMMGTNSSMYNLMSNSHSSMVNFMLQGCGEQHDKLNDSQ
jgi:hypothetical protein